MTEDREKAATPLVRPHDDGQRERKPEPVPTDAPASTDDDGKAVDLPDRGGVID